MEGSTASVDFSAASGVPDSLLESRHLPRRFDVSNRRQRTLNHLVRATAKRIAGADDPSDETYPFSDLRSNPVGNDALRPRVETDLRRHLLVTRASHPRLRRRSRAGRTVCAPDDADEAHDLARSGLPLPSDRLQLTRCPTLTREEAFYHASTSKSCTQRSLSTNIDPLEDAQLARLYQIGLLYDDDEDDNPEHDHGGSFNLNSIRHEQPVYAIRPAKRVRWSSRSSKSLCSTQPPLATELSFSDLGDDNAVAQYFASSSPSQCTYSPPGAGDKTNSSATSPSRTSLRIVYDLTGTTAYLDVDASQPPDLMADTLSEYEMMSDSECDDTLPQREVHNSDETLTSDSWIMLGDTT